MASRLRRRIATVFPAAARATGVASSSVVGTIKNLPPVWNTPETLTVYQVAGQWSSYQFSATDPEGQTITYAVTSGWAMPAGWGLPTIGLMVIPPNQTPGTSYFSLDASDGLSATSRVFAVTVANNTAPTWTTAAAFSVTQGTTSYQLVATDPDPQTVTYALQGGSSLPSGWSLSSSGLLTIPSNATAQQYPAFTVLAGDGITTTARTFTVTVSATSGSGSVTISWTAPTTNSNGDSFNNSTPDRTLAGYRVYYDTISPPVARYATTTDVFITITGLLAGTWYFTVTALDGDGDEGTPSDVFTKVVT